VTIEIFNIRGQKVRKLEMKGENFYSTTWDGTDNSGKALPSGLYFAQLKAGTTAIAQHKMMLIK
jgi:flagellar hook assembly protein FlgD